MAWACRMHGGSARLSNGVLPACIGSQTTRKDRRDVFECTIRVVSSMAVWRKDSFTLDGGFTTRDIPTV